MHSLSLKSIALHSLRLLPCTVLSLTLGVTLGHSEELYVQVKTAVIRQEPKHWAKAVAEVNYGAQVTADTPGGGWRQVSQAGGIKGFLHSSALSSRAIVLTGKSGDGIASFDEGEIVLAGKGFSQEVEDLFKGGTDELNYQEVDRLLAVSMNWESVKEFLANGKLLTEVTGEGNTP